MEGSVALAKGRGHFRRLPIHVTGAAVRLLKRALSRRYPWACPAGQRRGETTWFALCMRLAASRSAVGEPSGE